MKRLKKALAILSSVMMISVCVVSPICAEEATESTDNEQNIINVEDLKPADAPMINKITIRTAAYVARKLAKGQAEELANVAYLDYNEDGVINIRDAAAIAYDCAARKL